MALRNIYMPDSIPYGANIGYDNRVVIKTFPDGENAVSIPMISPDDEICLIGECSSAAASELFLAAAYEIASQGPHRFSVINTYFRHARSERVDGEFAALAKFQARQWSGLGNVFPGVRLYFVELHKDLVLHYFEGPVVTKNLIYRPLLERAIRSTRMDQPVHPLVYATVDDGGVYEAKKLADAACVGFAHIEKKRLSGSETKILNVLGDNVNGCNVVIFDDMIATGGSMIKAAQAFKDRGALTVRCAATHGVFVGNAVEKFRKSCIDQIIVTDSHPNARKAAELAPALIQVKTLHPM